MKSGDILKNNNLRDLEQELGDKREELRKFRFSISQSKMKNVKAGLETRRDIARILTRLRQLKAS